MKKIGLFYGSDTGYTEGVANQIVELMGTEAVDLIDIYQAEKEQFDNYELIIIGLSTWNDGELQSDWDDFYDDFQTIDFSGKTVALFGLGDQHGYGEYFIDGVGILAEVVYENGGQIVGVWPTEGYTYSESKAEFEPGWFLGLAIDEDNQPDLTKRRVSTWVAQIKEEFAEAMNNASV